MWHSKALSDPGRCVSSFDRGHLVHRWFRRRFGSHRLHAVIIQHLVLGVSQFARYLTRMGITDITHIGDDHIRRFVATLPVSKYRKKYSMPSVSGSRAARRLIRHLRKIGIVGGTSDESSRYVDSGGVARIPPPASRTIGGQRRCL